MLQFTYEINNLLSKKREKNNLSRGKIPPPPPPRISNGPSLRGDFVIGIFINSNLAKHFQNNNFFNKPKPVINPCNVQMRAPEGTEIA